MREGRFLACAQGRCGRLYVCGGCHIPAMVEARCLVSGTSDASRWIKPDILDTVETFLPGFGWQAMPSLAQPRSDPASACSARYIYLCGGSDGTRALDSVERWDLVGRAWETLPWMSERRMSCMAATCDAGRLFVCGGHDGCRTLASLECFDPSSGSWGLLKSMRWSRASAGITLAAGRLLVFGGHEDDGGGGKVIRRSAECFDLESGLWEAAPPMPAALTELGSSCVPA